MLVMDSLLGIKYQMLDKNAPGLSEEKLNSDIPKGYKLYKNNYSLLLAYNVSSDMKKNIEYGLNPFENQNKFLSAVTGDNSNVYKSCEISYGSSSENSESIKITAGIDGPMYIYTDALREHSDKSKPYCEIYVNGKFVQKTCARFLTNAVYIGDFEKGESVDVTIKHIIKNNVKHKLYASQLDMDEFTQVYQAVSEASVTDLNIVKNKVTGTYTTDTDSTVMLTIPYSDGWTVSVDGKKAPYSRLGDTFIGIDLTAGTHEISMKYSTLHKNAGVAASALGIAGFAAWCIAESLLKKKKSK